MLPPPFFLVLFVLLCTACAVQVPPKHISGVVRERDTGALVQGAEVRWTAPDGTVYATEVTGPLGYFHRRTKHLQGADPFNGGTIRISKQHAGRLLTDTVHLSPFVEFNEVYVDLPEQRPRNSFSVADMHYHVSMRAQNGLGQALYDADMHGADVDGTAFWFKRSKGLRVLDEGKWKKVPTWSPQRWERLAGHADTTDPGKAYRRVHTLLEGRWVRAKRGNNKVTHWTQATLPHVMQGRVMLGYNAISPFEHNLNDEGYKRKINAGVKSGISIKWLQRIGGAKGADAITHWENFKSEYTLFSAQDTAYGNTVWSRYHRPEQLPRGTAPTPVFVAVVEGGHAIQDDLFPNDVKYDIEARNDDQQEALKVLLRARIPEDTVMLARLSGKGTKEYAQQVADTTRQVYDKLKDDIKAASLAAPADTATRLRLEAEASRLANDGTQYVERQKQYERAVVDGLLLAAIDTGVARLKNIHRTVGGPAVRMVTVAHLSYNGMMGHASALDDAGGPASLIARRVYDIGVSSDRDYTEQWRGIFFSVPGPNKFGRHFIDLLLDSVQGHRILVDLKHADVTTRTYFFDSVMARTGAPPICSHCAVTGRPRGFSSPYNDEYSILRAPFTTTFYPFSINLYDEEIVMIHRGRGIIGITLEQRVLGGHVNALMTWRVARDKQGRVSGGSGQRLRHWEYLDRRFKGLARERYAADTLRGSVAAFRYTERDMGLNALHARKRGQRVREVTRADYRSAEPFLNNLFHIIDRIHEDQGDGWDTTFAVLEHPWRYVCLGSDLDGLIDPIDICPNADGYTHFRERLRHFIPLFLELRSEQDPQARHFNAYFTTSFTVDDALDLLFYESLRAFTVRNFKAVEP